MIIRDSGVGGELPVEPQNSDTGEAASDAAADDRAGASDRQPKGDHNRRLALGIDIDDFAAEALARMQQRNITQLIVTDAGRFSGFIHLHDLLREGLV